MEEEEVTPRGCLLTAEAEEKGFMKLLIWAWERPGQSDVCSMSGAMLGVSSTLSYFILRIPCEGGKCPSYFTDKVTEAPMLRDLVKFLHLVRTPKPLFLPWSLLQIPLL